MHFIGRFVMFMLLAGACIGVEYGMDKATLIQELGKPTSALARPGSGREILIYPNGVRIELERGKVVGVKGLDLAAVPGGAAPEANAGSTTEAGPKVAPEEQKARAEAEAKAEKEMAAADAKARAEMEKAIGDMERAYDQAEEEPATSSFIVSFGLEVLIKWLLMIAALKLTFKYWGADVGWGGLMIAAGADTGVRVVLGVIGRLMDLSTLFYADEAVAAIVLVLVLRRVSTNQSLQQAVTITMTCKVFSIVVGSFLVTVMLHALH